MNLRIAFCSVALLCLSIGVATEASASETSDVDQYNVWVICKKINEMAVESSPVADRLGLDGAEAKARKTWFGLILLAPAVRLQKTFGDAWPSLSAQLSEDIAGNLQNLWNSDLTQFDQMAAYCDKSYQAAKQ